MKSYSFFQNKKAQLGGEGIGVSKLYNFVLLIVLVGMIIGIGIIVLDKFSSTIFYQRVDFNDSLTPTANNSITSLTSGNITKVSKVYNNTYSDSAMSSDCYVINTTTGEYQVLILNNATCLWDHDAGRAIYIIYDFKDFATATRDATASVSTEVSNIATDWISLIVTVFILSIILFLVIRSFAPMAGVER